MPVKLNPEANLSSKRHALGQAFASTCRAIERSPGRIRLSARPSESDLQHAGRYVAKELFEGAAVPLLKRGLLDHGCLHGQCSTVRGRAVAEFPQKGMRNKDQSVVRPVGKPLPAASAAAGFKGNVAPNGTRKVAGMAGLQFTLPARCFDGEEARFRRVKNKNYREGEVLVLRHQGPRHGSGMRENAGIVMALFFARQRAGLASYCALSYCGAPAEKAYYANV